MHAEKSRRIAGRAAGIVFIVTVTLALPLQAQTFTVLHTFSGGAGGNAPTAGLTVDRAGNFYGTASEGGRAANCLLQQGCGIVFKLARSGSGWILSPIYSFQGNNVGDGANPFARPVFGPDGALYGTTSAGGGQRCAPVGCGIVYRLTPSPTTCRSVPCSWNETILQRFQGGNDDAAQPGYGDVTFDPHGNIYGTTIGGGGGLCGTFGCGAVYELSPSQGGWSESLLHAMLNGGFGFLPYSGVILDSSGNLYGTTAYTSGAVYELMAGNGWSETTLYNFLGQNESWPSGGLIFDQQGNLYGTTASGGTHNGGTVFELVRSGGGWTFTVLYNLPYTGDEFNSGPAASLTMDVSGNLYGTTYAGGTHNFGSVFKLSPSGGSWTYTSLHDFTCGSDGCLPFSNVLLAPDGNLYGTASGGASPGLGVIWQITP